MTAPRETPVTEVIPPVPDPVAETADTAPAAGRSAESAAPVLRNDWMGAVAAGLLATFLSWFRLPIGAWDTLWAEDGSVFLFPWANGAGWSSVLAPYDGYLHFVPRLLAGLIYAFSDVRGYADSVIVSSCLVYGVVAGLVYVFSRFVLALITVLAPVAGWESMHNLANLHWFLLWITPWLLLASPRSRVGLVLMSLLALAIALTEVQAVVLVPLVLWLWKKRDRWPIFIAFATGLIAQGVSVLLNPRVRVPAPSPPWDSVAVGYLLNSGISFWDSRRTDMTAMIVHFGFVVGVVAIVPFLVAFTLAFWRGNPQVRTATVTLLLASSVGWTIAFVINHDPNYYYSRIPIDSSHPLTLVRWATASQMFLVASVPLAVGVLALHNSIWQRWAPLMMVSMVAVMGTSLVQEGHPRGGLPWHAAVDSAEHLCQATSITSVDIPIQPVNWFLVLPCPLVIAD